MDSKKIFIGAQDVSEAARQVLNITTGQIYRDEKVFYFHGFSGLGVTPVLKCILRNLMKWHPELRQHKVLYIDCSEWHSGRSLQRKIAEELKFDQTTMDMFDKNDDEDDFNGVDQASRNLITDVSIMIDKTLREQSFIIIFVNGSDEELELSNFGVPYFTTFVNNIMIWGFNKRSLTLHSDWDHAQLRHTQRMVLAGIKGLKSSKFSELLHEEAASIVARHPSIESIDLTAVTDCCFYEMFLYYSFHRTTEYAWAAHASNYWICDGIIKRYRTREISDALHSEIRWEGDAYLLGHVCQNIMKNDPDVPFLVVNGDTVYNKKPYRWIYLTSNNLKVQDQDLETVMEKASSLFVAFERTDKTLTRLPDGLFKHCSNLGVLVLFCCTFNFAAPPFIQCRGLRFLGLDHCRNDLTREGEVHHIDWPFLYSLWVLDIRYTDLDEILTEGKIDLMANLRELNIEGLKCWQYISRLQTRLSYLERLRIIKPTQHAKMSDDTSNSFVDKKKLEVLDLSGNNDMKGLPTSLSNASSLQVLVLDGCDGLETVELPNRLPSSLASFSFDSYGPASHDRTSSTELPTKSSRSECPSNKDKKDVKTSKISLRGCTKLNCLFLRGLSNLMELDLSGSALKVLDFESMVVDIPRLKRLFLLGCEHLRAIKWGPTLEQPSLELLCIDTRRGTWNQTSPARHESFLLQVRAILTDVRLARSLSALFGRRIGQKKFDIQVHSSVVDCGDVQLEATNNEATKPTRLQRHYLASLYTDVLTEIGDAPIPMQAFPEPPVGRLDRHVEITGCCRILESELPRFYGITMLMLYYTESLHLHDTTIRASLPRGSWQHLRWFRMERCPILEAVVFPSDSLLYSLESIWVSELAMAHALFGREVLMPKFPGPAINYSFSNLQHLHLRSCPRLQYVLPLGHYLGTHLKTIHVVHCGDLRHIFALSKDYPRDHACSIVLMFPELTTIHLHDLPMLREICEAMKMFAPKLQAVRIRGCFNLRRLPAVDESFDQPARGVRWPRPALEMEKDVWDALEWDGMDTRHHRSYYEPPLHSHYYRKCLLRRSVLR